MGLVMNGCEKAILHDARMENQAQVGQLSLDLVSSRQASGLSLYPQAMTEMVAPERSDGMRKVSSALAYTSCLINFSK
jgi:hypothetical protein